MATCAGEQRGCVICGASLSGRRADAMVCGGPCRAERSRLRAILNSSNGRAYSSVSERLGKSRRRTRSVSGGTR
jgi:hypothetical protein